MTDRDLTRRSVVQGAGLVGVAGLLGTATAAAQEQTETSTDEQTTAIRVAHAGADAPNVDVRLGSGDPGEGTPTDGENATGGDGPTVEVGGLGFGGVSNYREVDPGTYRLRVVVANDNVLDQILEIFGGDGGEETVIYEDSLELDAGSTYTAVAFGQIAAGPAAGDGAGGDATDEGGEGTEADEESSDDAASGQPDGARQAFQVELLEDELDAPPAGSASVRLFNAVPDAEALSVTELLPVVDTAAGGNDTGDVADTTTDADVGGTATDGGATAADDGGSADQTETTLLERLAFGESETVEFTAGSHTLQIGPTTAAEADDGLDEGTETESEDGFVEETETEASGLGNNETASTATGEADRTVEGELSLDGGAVYSSLVVGYFDPTGAAEQRGQAADGTDAAGQNDTGNGGAETGDGEESTGGQAGETDTDSPRAQDVQDRAIELVTVKSSQNGSRVAGGNRNFL